MKSQKPINGITGEYFLDSFHEENLFLIDNSGNETKDFINKQLYVFPKAFQENKEEEKKCSMFITPLMQSIIKNKKDEKESLQTKKRENLLIKNLYDRSIQEQRKTEKYIKTYVNRNDALFGLFLHVRYIFGEFENFVKKVRIMLQHFVDEERKLTKKTEQIYTDLLIKEIDSNVTHKKVKSLFDFVDLDESLIFKEVENLGVERINNEKNKSTKFEEKKLIEKHFNKIKQFKSFTKKKIRGWENLKTWINVKVGEDEKYIRSFVKNDSLEEVNQYLSNIKKSNEELKRVIENHSMQVKKLESEENELERINILNEMNLFDHLDKVGYLEDSIIEDLKKCHSHQQKSNKLISQFHRMLLENRKNMTEIMESNEGKFSKLSNGIIEISLKRLIFAANLPRVYEKCIYELIRRKNFQTNLKREVFQINEKLSKICDEENKMREEFLKEMELKLSGSKVPSDLVVGIYDYVQTPFINIFSIENSMIPSFSVLNSIRGKFDEEEYEVISDGTDSPSPTKTRSPLVDNMSYSQVLKNEKKFDKQMNQLITDLEIERNYIRQTSPLLGDKSSLDSEKLNHYQIEVENRILKDKIKELEDQVERMKNKSNVK